MSKPSTAREALLVELMGEIGTLLDRIDALKPALRDCCDAIDFASAKMAESCTHAQARIVGLADASTNQAINHIARSAQQIARTHVEVQSDAMRAVAHEIFRTELTAALCQLSHVINKQATQSQKHRRALNVIAMCMSLIAGAMLTYLVLMGAADQITLH